MRARLSAAGATLGLVGTGIALKQHLMLLQGLDQARLLYACEGRKGDVLGDFADDLEAHGACAENVRELCIDMSSSYQAGASEHRPWAQITCDEFHVIQLVNKAVDEVRRQEVKGVPQLRRTRYLWLKDKHARSDRQIVRFADIKALNLKTHHAYRIKEALRDIFRTATCQAQAEPLLKSWYSWARRYRLAPIKKVAKTLKQHWQGILNAFDSKLTNGHTSYRHHLTFLEHLKLQFISRR